MHYNFDEVINRDNTNSKKWDYMSCKFPRTDLIPMWIADGEFPCPQGVVDAVNERAKHGIYGYSFVPEEFYDVTIEYIGRKYNWEIQKDWILFSPGLVPAITVAVQSLTDPGDEIIILSPVYHPFTNVTKENNRSVSSCDLILKAGKYYIDFKELEKRAKSEKAKMMLLSNPHNPVGRVYTEDELRRIAAICLANGVILISDEIHSDIVFDGHEHVSVASLGSDYSQNTITLYSPSKTFNIAGLQNSSCIIENPIMRHKVTEQMAINHINSPNAFASVAYIAAYKNCDDYLEQLLQYLKGSYDYLDDFFKSAAPRIKLIEAEGTYLAWIDCRGLELDNSQLEDFFINKCKVGLYLGGVFGKAGDGFIRMNIACSRKMLDEVCQRIKVEYDQLF